MLFHNIFCFPLVKIMLCCEFIIFMQLYLSLADKCFMFCFVFFFFYSGYGSLGGGGLGGGGLGGGGQGGTGFGGYGGGY